MNVWIKNKKSRYTPSNPRCFYIKVGFKGVYTFHGHVFQMLNNDAVNLPINYI